MKFKIRNKLRLGFAILIAPVIALFALPLGNCALVAIGKSKNGIAGMSGYAWDGLPPAEIAMLIIGLPLVLAAVRLGKIRSWHFGLGGGTVGLLSASILGLIDRHLSIPGLAAVSVPSGVIASLIIWLVGVYGNLVSHSQAPIMKFD